MQINNSLQTGYTGTAKTGVAKEKEPQKEIVSLGQKNEDLQLMPDLKNLTSGPDVLGGTKGMLIIGGIIGGGGALMAGAGILGRILGGTTGAVAATALTGVAMGMFIGKDGDKIHSGKFIKAGLAGAAIAGAGAAISAYSIPLALVAGAIGGVGVAAVDIGK
jgi:hypothetical protein